MFGRNKKNAGASNAKAEQLEAARSAALNPKTKIFVMPEKFWLPDEPKKHFWTAGKVWTVVVLAMAILLAGVYFFLSSTQPTAPVVSQPTTPAVPEVLPGTPADIAPVEPVVEDTNPEEESVVPDDNTEPAAAAPLPPLVAPKSGDQDGDGLTDAEETLYGTDAQLTDSDGDSYLDGVELLGGFNPAGAGRLEPAGLYSTYTSPSGGYTIQHPANWSPVVSSQQGVQFATGTGEVVLILLQRNATRLPLLDWYKSIVPEVDVSTVKTKTISNVVAVQSDDERTLYFTLPGDTSIVFVVNHAIGSKPTVDFATTVETMVRSITLTSR